MTKETINLIFVAVALLILFLPILFGALRGKKKSALRLVWLLATGIVAILFASLVAKIVVESVRVQGKTIPEFLLSMIENTDETAKKAMQDEGIRASALELCTESSLAIVKLVAFAVCYWLLDLLLLPVYGVVAKSISRKKQKKQVTLQDGTIVPAMQKKESKGVLLGAVFGLCIGIVSLVITFVPVASISALALTIDGETQVEEEDGTRQGLLTSALGSNAEYLTAYQDSAVCSVMRATGLDAIEVFFGDGLTTMTVGGQKTQLSTEVKSLAPIYKDVAMVTKYDFSTLSKQDLSKILPLAQDLSQRVFDSKIAENLYDNLKVFVIDGLTNDEDFPVKLPKPKDDEVNQIVQSVVEQVKTMSFEETKSDIQIILSIATKVNDQSNLLVDISNGITFEKLQSDLTTDLASQINQDFANLNIVTKSVPAIAEPLVKLACEKVEKIDYNGESVGIEYTQNPSEVTADTVKNAIQNLLSDAVAVLKGVSTNSTHFDSTDCIKVEVMQNEKQTDYFVKKDILENIGGVVDAVKDSGIASKDTFLSALNYFQTIAKASVDKNLPSDYQKLAPAIDKMIDSIENVSDFSTEFAYFDDALQLLPTDVTQLSPKLLAEMADKVTESYVYSHNVQSGRGGNQDSKFVAEKLDEFVLDYVQKNFGDLIDLTQTDAQLLNEKKKKVESFGAEYNALFELFDFVDGKNADQITTTQNLKKIGGYLDSAKLKSKIFDDEICKMLLCDVIEKVDLPTEFANVQVDGSPIKTRLKSNVKSVESFETELECVGNVLNANTDSFSTLAEYGALLDKVSTSKLFAGTINAVIDNQFDKYSTDFADYQTVFDDIRSNILTLEGDYKAELACLDKLKDYVTNGQEKTIANARQFVSQNIVDSNGKSLSKLIDDNTLFDFVENALDGAKFDDKSIDDFGNLKTDLKNNIENQKQQKTSILTIFDEIDALQTYYTSNISDGVQIDGTLTKAKLEEFGKKLDGLKADTFADILDTKATNDIGKYALDNLNDSIQSNASVSDEKKQSVQATVDAVDYTKEVAYESLLLQIATDLGLE